MIAQRFFSLAIVVASVAVVANADPRLRATAELVNTEEMKEDAVFWGRELGGSSTSSSSSSKGSKGSKGSSSSKGSKSSSSSKGSKGSSSSTKSSSNSR
eukprot:CAMPEP_0197733778 /NCGR_PEP_ID=MMETSP1434-20131217/44079_1 /TAXON_ID=265543 /ORGANISM="Minutocellus polymorphus, Strain CCMP3303" /LENGTH=98 /DNA_ID=CAMNT_0043321171 /DNA_START=74 /DNA_END=370 /DNA_ORIENTATION=-